MAAAVQMHETLEVVAKHHHHAEEARMPQAAAVQKCEPLDVVAVHLLKLGHLAMAPTNAAHPPTMCTTPLPAKSTTPRATHAPGDSGSLDALSHP